MRITLNSSSEKEKQKTKESRSQDKSDGRKKKKLKPEESKVWANEVKGWPIRWTSKWAEEVRSYSD